jgi:hypothetical protein
MEALHKPKELFIQNAQASSTDAETDSDWQKDCQKEK